MCTEKHTFAYYQASDMKQYIVWLLLACGLGGHAQETKQPSFTPPFDFPLTLSGNFGELRANHFHGGLDFKTGGAVGKPVQALGDGYISRIRVTHGSGYVLDVCYDNGYSTINRHLDAFVSPIAGRVKKLQYEQQSWEVEITPSPDEYRVRSGQVIALGGNTGYSFGPHLHLDVIETATDEYIDPILFFRKHIKDHTAPKAEGFLLMPKPGKGVVDGKQSVYTTPVATARPVEAWGMVGAGIKAHDFMDGVSNRYGVYLVVLTVDGKEVFRSTVDRFASAENRYINSWAYRGYMKSFIDPGNALRMLKADPETHGWVNIDEERDYEFLYTLQDAFGNTSRYRFTVRGRQVPIIVPEHREKYFFAWNRTNYLQELGLTLEVPKGALYDDVPLKFRLQADSSSIAFTYRLNDEAVPLHVPAELTIGLRRQPVADTTKYYMAGVNSRGKLYSVGGKYEGGYMKASVRELATYTVAVDTIPPVVTPINPKSWSASGKIVYKLKDEETGIQSYRGTIDGQYALFGMRNSINQLIEYRIDPERVKRGSNHTLELVVVDNCGNETVTRTTFRW